MKKWKIWWAGEETIRIGQGLTQPHSLTNFDIQKHNQNKPRFNGVYSRNNLPKKNGRYVINVYKYKSNGPLWIALHVGASHTSTYFDSFGVEHIPNKTEKFIDNRIFITTIFRIHTYNSIICGYFALDFMLKGENC